MITRARRNPTWNDAKTKPESRNFRLMRAFNRVLKYLWPQWHRILLTLSCALIVAFLLSVSYATAIPLLKVIIAGGVRIDEDPATIRSTMPC